MGMIVFKGTKDTVVASEAICEVLKVLPRNEKQLVMSSPTLGYGMTN
jgi:hypothetical protein